ncbi:MAG: hypothetical protein KC441_09435, partial [Anaerolineales bacterium]|nr:hypothetical protein [Anaerolineales bacterium]
SATPVVTDTMLHTGKQSVQFGTVRLFGDPQTLSDQASGYGLLAAIGGDNTIHALWQEAGQWTYSQQQPNGGWSAPKHLPLDTDCQIQFAALSRMQVQANGTVQLAWVAENSLSTPYDEWLCYYERSPAGVWQPLRKYHFNEFPGEGTDSRQVNFKFAPDGVLHATWMHRTADYQWRLLYARRNTNGTWSSIETIAESFGADWFKTWLYMPDLAIEPNGTVHFVWMARETVVPSANLFYRSRASDGQWSPTGQVTFYADQYNPPGFDISLDVDAYGTLHLIYELEVSSNKNPFYYMRRTAGQWSTSVGLGALSSANEVETQLDAQGNLHVTWVEDQQVRYARTNRRSLNFTEFRLTEFPVYQIKLLVDGTGKLHFFEQGWEESLYVLVDAEGNKILQKSLPNLNYLGFAVGQKGDPYLFALDWTQYNQLLCIGPARVLQDSVWAMSQVISIPADMETPLLSFFYSYNSLFVDEQNSFDILLDDGQVTRLLKQTQVVTGWQHQWFDLSPWKGQVVTLIFRLQQKQQTPNTWAFVDDVSLGTTHPDLWVSGSSTSGLPGEIIEHTLVYGNRGGAVASGAVLTYTLPAELSFISASPPPVSTSPLVWTLEDVPAKSGPATLSVLLQISPTAVPYSTLHSTAFIQPAYTGVELETLNNYAEGETVISRFIYLPLIAR